MLQKIRDGVFRQGKVTSVTSDNSGTDTYDMAVLDRTLPVDSTLGVITITLPNVGLAAGKIFAISAKTGAANAVTVQDSDESVGWIDRTLNQNNEDLVVYSDGRTYHVLSTEADVYFGDNDVLYYGDDNDLGMQWDGTNFTILPLTDDTGQFRVGNGTLDMDVRITLGSAAQYVQFDVGDSFVYFEGVDARWGDDDEVQFGDAVGGDVSMTWDGDSLNILPVTNDIGSILVGNGTKDIDLKVFLGSVTEYVEFDVGGSILRSNVPIRLDNNTGAWNSALLLGGGTGGDPVTTAAANVNFIEFRFENTSATGDNRGIYNRLYFTTAGAGGGCSFRTYTDVVDVRVGTAHGAHISLGFGEDGSDTGSVSGLGIASRNTLHIPDSVVTAGGTYAACMPEIFSNGASSDPSGVTELSFIRCANAGDATGVALVDDKAFLITLAGGSIAGGNVISATADGVSTHRVRCSLAGTTLWLLASNAATG